MKWPGNIAGFCLFLAMAESAAALPLAEGFETWTDTVYGTSDEFYSGAGGTWQTIGCITETNYTHAGAHAYRLTNGLAGGGNPFLHTPTKTGGVGEVSFWYRMSDPSNGIYSIQYGTGIDYPNALPAISSASTNYLKYSYTFTDPSWATNQIHIQISRNGSGSGLIIDDFNIGDFVANPTNPPASYATNIPSGFVTPPTNIYITTNFLGPVPTSEFWSPVLGVRSSGMLPARPLLYYAKGWALELSYPQCAAVSNGDYIRGFFVKDLDVGATGAGFPAKPSGESRIDGYGDFSANVQIGTNDSHLMATLVHGSPYAYVRFTNCAPVINCWTGYVVEATDTNASYIVLQIRQRRSYAQYTNHYVLFAASGTTWNTSSTNAIVPVLPAGKQFLSIAALPSHSSAYQPAELALLQAHAFAFVTNTHAALSYTHSNATVTAAYACDVDVVQGTQSNTIMCLLPHHWKHSITPLTPGVIYDSVLGDMKVAETNAFSMGIPFRGIVPQFPAPTDASWTQSVFSSLANTIAGPSASVDTYAKGKDLERLARVLPALDSCGLTDRFNIVLADLKSQLQNWFTYTTGEPNQFFAYDARWGALCGYDESFGSVALMNDQHFHYGMFAYSAAIAAMYDHNFGTNYAPVIEKVIREYNNPSRDISGPDPLPWLRYFDPWEAHCYASGLGGGPVQGPSSEQLYAGEAAEASSDGPDEESTSECINSWAGMFLWGQVMNKSEFLDMGAIGYALESCAVQEYWYDADRTNRKPGYLPTMVSRVFGNKVDPYTWFSAEMQHAWGIQYILTGPHMTYQGYFKPYRVSDYGYFKTNSPGGTAAIADGWKDIHWMYRCFFEPAQVLSEYSTNTPTDGGNTRANLYYWIHAMNSLGEVNTNVLSDFPGLVVMNNNGTDTYVACNLTGGSATAHLFNASSGAPAGFLVLTNQRTGVVSSGDDADGDGLKNGDEFAQNSDIYRADTDGDGSSDWAEWFTGTKPDDPASLFKSLTFTGSALSWPGTTGRTYIVRGYPTAADAAAGTNGSNLLTVAGSSGTMTPAITLPPWSNAFITVTAQ